MKFVFLDTETTGIDVNDRLCQVAYKIGDQMKGELFAPPLPIKYEAMAVHHITEQMVEDKPAFIGSEMHKELAEVLADQDTVLVAHNAQFDVNMLVREGIKPANVICTLKLIRFLDSEAQLSSYSLQFLRYRLGLNVGVVTAHDAVGDVIVLEKLFRRLLIGMQKKSLDLEVIVDDSADELIVVDDLFQEMIEISARPSIIRRFSFGKYNGKLLQEVLELDRSYLEWLLLQKKQSPEGETDWIYTLEQLLSS